LQHGSEETSFLRYRKQLKEHLNKEQSMGKKLKKENTPKQVPTLFDSSLKEIFVCF
jgi:hypothetical protein